MHALPEIWQSLNKYLDAFRQNSISKGSREVARFDRLMTFRDSSYEAQIKIDNAWKTILQNTHSEDATLSVFISLPDAAENQPFEALMYGKRDVDPTQEKTLHNSLAGHTRELIAYFQKPNSLEKLLADQAFESGEEQRLPKTAASKNMMKSAQRANELWQYHATSRGALVKKLEMIELMFIGSNPHRWYLTKQPLAADSHIKTYAKLVASLNRHLKSPKHSALATIAQANLPSIHLTPNQIRMAWLTVKDTRI